MGIEFSNGPIVNNGQSYTNTDNDACNFIKDVNTALTSATWQSQKTYGGIRFKVFALVQGAKFFGSIGIPLIIWDPANITPPPVGFQVVDLESTQLATLENLIGPFAVIVGGTPNGIGMDGGFLYMQISNIQGGDGVGNNIDCSVFPSGSVGIFDYSASGVGTGRSWGGGYTWTSKIYSGSPMVFSGTKNPAISVSFTDGTGSGTVYNAFSFSTLGGVQILANQYQVFIKTLSSYASGGFFVAGHLLPLGGLNQFNYINGPVVSAGGGDRSNGLSSIKTVSPSVNGVAVDNAKVTFQMPAFVGGNAELDLTGDVPTSHGGLPGIFFDAFISYAPSNFGGIFWDAFLISTAPALDTPVSFHTYDSNNCVVLLSTNGVSGQMNGALCVFTQSFEGSSIFSQIDSTEKGNTAISDLSGPSAFILAIDPATGTGAPLLGQSPSDYAF